MSTISKPYTFAGGTTILASEVNANFNTLYNEFNGSIEAANLANAAVNEDKLANNAVTNAKVSASAAIALTKLAAITASRVPVANASGFLIASAVTATELGYLSGVTSAIQTQIDGKEPVFSKNTGFNLNLGTTTGTVSEGDHTHPAADIVSGTLDNSRISAASVEQHVTKAHVDSLNVDADTVDGSHASAFAQNGGNAPTIYAGRVSSSAVDLGLPSGWTVSKVGTGHYRITHNLALVSSNDCAIVANVDAGVWYHAVASSSTNSFDITVWSDTTPTDREFSFIFVKF